ncbi:MAG: hypothetical protein R2839_05505 [Thermomicrobiales bacterium]
MIGVRLLPRVDFALSPVMADPEHLGTVLDHLIEQAMRQGESGDAVLIEILDTGFEAQVNISSSRSPTPCDMIPIRSITSLPAN